MPTDLDLKVPELISWGLLPVKEYRSWWYTGIVFQHSITKRMLLALTRTMRSGITFVPDPALEVLNGLDTATEDDLGNNLGNLRNDGFNHWSYQSQIGPQEWLKQQGILP